MDEITKERYAKQRAAATCQAQAGGTKSRREYMRMALKALDEAIAKFPDGCDVLKSHRASLAADLARLGSPDEREQLEERLAEVEEKLANARGLTPEKMLELLATREQLIVDFEEK